MEHLARSPQRRTKTEYYQFQPSSRLKRSNVMQKKEFESKNQTDSFDFAHQFSEGMQPTNLNEKELLQGLNERFAGFTEKVRLLETQNKILESEIEQLRQKKAASLSQVYDPEIKDLRKLVHEITLQKRKIEVEHRHLQQDLYILREKCEAEARHRSDAESSIMTLKKDINDAYLSKLQLDKKVQSLVEEIVFLKKNHQEEVSEMMAQLREAQVSTVEMKDFGKADITAALRDIRKQLEGHASSNVQQTEECFRARVAKLTEAAEMNREALQATKQEIHEQRRQLQYKSIELETVKGTKEALESQLNALEERHDAEISHYQDTIGRLEHELKRTKCEISGHLREYQDLLNVKMALDVEIASYRKLLEGEETRLSSISGTHISLPYVYRQSPVYTLPCFAKHRGTTTKTEPQYKFVEEIITETTREVEMTEIEETESEEISGGGESTGTERESGEEEEKVQATIGAEVAAEEEDIPTVEEEQEKTAETADMERPSKDTEEVEDRKPIEGKASPEEEITDTEPADSLAEELETKAKVERTNAEKKETEKTPDAVEITEPVKESVVEKLQEDRTDMVKVEYKETEEVTARMSPQQIDSEGTTERDHKEQLQLEVPSEDTKQEKETKESEESEDSPLKEVEDKVQKGQSAAAQHETLDKEQSPEKMADSLTEVKGREQLQDTESPVMSQVKDISEPIEKGGKDELVKEDIDPGKSLEDSSLKTEKSEQETPPVTEVTSKESFKETVESPLKPEEDNRKEEVSPTATDSGKVEKVAKEPEVVQSTKSIPLPKVESKSTEELHTEECTDSKEMENGVKAVQKGPSTKEVTEEPMIQDASTAMAKPDKDKSADKTASEPEGTQKPEATLLPKEESKSASTEKLDKQESTDSKEMEKGIKEEQKGGSAKELMEKPMTQDATTVMAEIAQSEKDKAAEKISQQPEGSKKPEATFLPKEDSKSISIEKLDAEQSTDSKEKSDEVKTEQKEGVAKYLTEEPTSEDAPTVMAKIAQSDKDKAAEKISQEPEGSKKTEDISLPKEEKTILKTEEPKDVKGRGPDSEETKATGKTTSHSEGEKAVKEVGSTNLPESKDMVPISDVKDKTDVAKKVKENGEPQTEENGLYESEATTPETTTTKADGTKVPVSEIHAETIKDKTSEPKTSP